MLCVHILSIFMRKKLMRYCRNTFAFAPSKAHDLLSMRWPDFALAVLREGGKSLIGVELSHTTRGIA
jgi:hypothetical protein